MQTKILTKILTNILINMQTKMVIYVDKQQKLSQRDKINEEKLSNLMTL